MNLCSVTTFPLLYIFYLWSSFPLATEHSPGAFVNPSQTFFSQIIIALLKKLPLNQLFHNSKLLTTHANAHYPMPTFGICHIACYMSMHSSSALLGMNAAQAPKCYLTCLSRLGGTALITTQFNPPCQLCYFSPLQQIFTSSQPCFCSIGISSPPRSYSRTAESFLGALRFPGDTEQVN